MEAKVMLVCGFGLGTSLVLKMTLDAVLQEEGLRAQTFCSDEMTAKGQRFDLVITSTEFAGRFMEAGKPVIVIENFLSKEEVRQKCVDEIRKFEEQ
ncbi:PTS sugar transporter subunit IIB [bacterium]|nr:PTS sugar transporter subunit IIB [bacterium]